jgi:hypothetical protein
MGRKLVGEQNFFATAGLALSLVVVGCSGAPKQVGDENSWANSDSSSSRDTSEKYDTSSETTKSRLIGEEGGLNEDQTKQMEIALRRGGDKAANCAEVVAGAPTGEGDVEVVFDGQKGRVTDVTVGAPFAGTAVEACIRRSFVGEIVLPFDGEPKSVPYKVKLGKKGAAAPAPAPDKKK